MAIKADFEVVKNFDDAPNSMLLSIPTAGVIAKRSHASMYRHINAGELELIKIGCSSRIRVGDLRRLIKANGGVE